LVDAVVDDLPEQMVIPRRPGAADVHARPAPDRLEPLEDQDVLRRIGAARAHILVPRITTRSLHASARSEAAAPWRCVHPSWTPACPCRRAPPSRGAAGPPRTCAPSWSPP